jgi:hypothetical protein
MLTNFLIFFILGDANFFLSHKFKNFGDSIQEIQKWTFHNL